MSDIVVTKRRTPPPIMAWNVGKTPPPKWVSGEKVRWGSPGSTHPYVFTVGSGGSQFEAKEGDWLVMENYVIYRVSAEEFERDFAPTPPQVGESNARPLAGPKAS